jgi:glycosyltransferase involved in cell wall biosynthesis
MATKMWVWKHPDLKTKEKGVLMQVRIHSFYNWCFKHKIDLARVKKYYNIIMGEHLEITNPLWRGVLKDRYAKMIKHLDLWFYSCEKSRLHVIKQSRHNALKVHSLMMSAVCYLTDQKFWTPDPETEKQYDFVVCYNDFVVYKRPMMIADFFEKYSEVYPHSRMAVVYRNSKSSLLEQFRDKLARFSVDYIHSPNPVNIRDIYRKSKCLLHSSSTESGPRVIGEAMSCGVPVVVAKESWNASIYHLREGVLSLPKSEWKDHIGVEKVAEFITKAPIGKLHSLVGTSKYINKIDLALLDFNSPWTLGKLNPPLWVGEHNLDAENDEKFYQITGQRLV